MPNLEDNLKGPTILEWWMKKDLESPNAPFFLMCSTASSMKLADSQMQNN